MFLKQRVVTIFVTAVSFSALLVACGKHGENQKAAQPTVKDSSPAASSQEMGAEEKALATESLSEGSDGVFAVINGKRFALKRFFAKVSKNGESLKINSVPTSSMTLNDDEICADYSNSNFEENVLRISVANKVGKFVRNSDGSSPENYPPLITYFNVKRNDNGDNGAIIPESIAGSEVEILTIENDLVKGVVKIPRLAGSSYAFGRFNAILCK